MLAAAVHTRERFLVEQTHKSVSCCDFLHDLHGQLVVIRSDICRCINRSKLVLSRCYLVVLCLGEDAELPELIVQVLHESSYAGLDYAEIVVVKLLTFGRLCTEQCAAGVLEVRTLLIHLCRNQEIFLLGTDGGDDTFCRFIAEKTQNSESLLAEDLHGAKQRSLLVQRMSAVGAECRGDAERPAFDEGVGGRIPGRVSSRLEGSAESARGEGGGVGFALDQFLAGKFHDDAAVR